jgi:hypothetical protein
MNDNTYYKEIMINYALIIILCLFLVVYIVINFSIIKEGNIYGGNIPKTIIITGVIFLILYVFLTWEDEEEIVVIPKYNINNKVNIEDNSPVPKGNLKIENKYNTKYFKEQIIKDTTNNIINKNNFTNKQELINNINKSSDNVMENSNIFVTQKNKAKFGIKF